MRKQILIIGGGDTFDTNEEYINFIKNFKLDWNSFKKKKWKDSLKKDLEEQFEIIFPEMPCRWNAKYNEWKIWFDKFLPYLENGIILIGHSLGGIFLAKYLSENNVNVDIRALFLIAAPFDETEMGESLVDFVLPKNLDGISSQVENIFIYHSKDDPVVPFSNSKKYKEVLPKVELVVFNDKSHFNQEEFPELVEKIKTLN